MAVLAHQPDSTPGAHTTRGPGTRTKRCTECRHVVDSNSTLCREHKLELWREQVFGKQT